MNLPAFLTSYSFLFTCSIFIVSAAEIIEYMLKSKCAESSEVSHTILSISQNSFIAYLTLCGKKLHVRDKYSIFFTIAKVLILFFLF